MLFGFVIYHFNRFTGLCLSRYKEKLIRTNGNVSIGANVILSHPQNIFIGKNSYINKGYVLAFRNSSIRIGENCMISHNVHIRTRTHQYLKKDIPMIQQGHIEKDISIGNNVWIGFGAQIMPGVSIGDNTIVGAGSIVTKDISSNSIAVGVPARKIKSI